MERGRPRYAPVAARRGFRRWAADAGRSPSLPHATGPRSARDRRRRIPPWNIAVPWDHASVAPIEVKDFHRILGILRKDPDALAADRLRSRPTFPRRKVFSFARVLRIVLPAIIGSGLLFAFLILLTTDLGPWSPLLFVAGMLVAIVMMIRSRRRVREAADTGSEKADSADIPIASDGGQASPSSDDGYQPSDQTFPLRPHLTPAAIAPPSRLRRFLLFAGSLSAYGAIAAASLPDLTTTWVVLTVLLHEAGHVAAMYALGYSGLSMVFIPFIAGAVAGHKERASASDQLVTLLAGPAPGLLIGCLIYWLDSLQPLPTARALAIWLVALNLLNLLPVWPLDGGRICWILFSRHSATAQAVLSAASLVGACFLFLAPQGGTVFLVVMGLLLLAWIPSRYRHARAALAFFERFPEAPVELERLSERQLFALYGLAAAPKNGDGRSRALEMTAIHSRAARLPRSSPRFRFLLLYVLLWLLALTTAAGTGLQDDARTASVALGSLFDAVMPWSSRS